MNVNFNKSTKNNKIDKISNDKLNIPQNKIIKVINSREVNNQNQKPFGYSTENYFTGQKSIFNSNLINKNINGNFININILSIKILFIIDKKQKIFLIY
jgi:hypothetical protein